MIRHSPLLAVALPLLLAPSVAASSVSQDPLRISAAEFPGVASRIDLFEERVNSPDPAIRRRVLIEITYFAYVPSDELVAFLRRMTRDTDAVVRGRAVHKLHDYWVPLDPDDLPKTFCGYSDARIVDRNDPQLEKSLLKQLATRGADGGWAAYEVGLLGLRAAIPSLVAMQDRLNPFVRYAAARALFDLGERDRARTAFSAQAAELLAAYERALDSGGGRVVVSRGHELQPYYAILTCRGLAECGESGRADGLAGLVRLFEVLEPSDDPNDQANLPYLRHTLRGVTGHYFGTAGEAREAIGRPGRR